MLIKSLWAWRKNEDSPELLLAWDEFSVDENFDGWQNECRTALDSMKSDISDLGYRYLDLRVDASAIEECFYTNEVEAKVEKS